MDTVASKDTTALLEPKEPTPKGSNGRPMKQEHWAFAQAHFYGMNLTEAYMEAYPKASRETALRAGSELMSNQGIRDALQELRDARGHVMSLTKGKITQIRSEIAQAPLATHSDRLRACSDEERMQGYTAPRALKPIDPGSILLLYAGPTIPEAFPLPSNPPEDALETIDLIEDTPEDTQGTSAKP